MIYSSGVRNFGNKNNERAIYLPRHGSSDEKRCNRIYDGVADHRLELLIENGRKTVWAWGFKVIRTKQSIFYLILRGNFT